jgi:small nuclear ribonucleoprotein (snRNP)-like protein
MSANINFAAGPAAVATGGAGASSTTATDKAAVGASSFSPAGAEAKSKSHMILPYEVLFNLVGRRVTVLLTKKGAELEGTLQSVDSDKGDMFLSDVVQYNWVPATSTSADDAETEEQVTDAAKRAEEGYRTCFGGGQRKEVSRCSQAMVNSAFVALVTPTLFVPE